MIPALFVSFDRLPLTPNGKVDRLGGKPIHFLHIGKTGGTAIKDALSPIAEEYHLFLHPHEVRLRDIPPGEQFFFFVRDPLTRFTTGFYSRMRRGMPRYNREWSAAEKDAFSNFQTANDLAEALSSPDRKRVKQAKAALRGIQHVRNGYRDWIVGEQELRKRADSLLMVGL
jgi:hypothetical protein